MTDPMPLLARARAAMPGLAELDAALDDVQARMAAAGARATSESDLVNVAAAEAVRSYAVPDGLGQQLLDQRQVNAEVDAETGALRRIQERLEAAERDRHRAAADDGLAVLAAELAVIVDAGRAALDALGSDVHDADSAIAADRADEWRQTRALAEDHDRLRTVQRLLVSGAMAPPQQGRLADDVSDAARLLVDLFGTVRDAAQHVDVAAHLKVAAMGPDAQRWTTGLISGQPVATNQPPAPPWLVADPVEVLRFVTRRDVEAWVPTITALRAQQNEVQRRKGSGDEESQPVTSAEIAVAWHQRGERSPWSVPDFIDTDLGCQVG